MLCHTLLIGCPIHSSTLTPHSPPYFTHLIHIGYSHWCHHRHNLIKPESPRAVIQLIAAGYWILWMTLYSDRGLRPLKTKCCYKANAIVIGGNPGCHIDKPRQCHWRQSWYHGNSQFSLPVHWMVSYFVAGVCILFQKVSLHCKIHR